MHSTWVPWFHLCWRGPCTQLYPSCWNTQQNSQARLLKHTVPKAFPLMCHCLHFLQQKPIHHVQKLDTLSVWNDLQFHIPLCTFPRAGGKCLCKTQLWGALKFNLCSYSSSVCCYRDGEAEGQCRCLPWSYQRPWVGHEAAGRQYYLHGAVSPFFPNLPGDNNIGESRWGSATATPGSPRLGWHLQASFLVKVKLAVVSGHPACIKAAWNLHLAGCVKDGGLICCQAVPVLG